jgi:hypothetical protein
MPAADSADLDNAEAAAQLGIAEAAVELAIERGFLRGHFDEARGRWRVRLDYTSSMTEPRAADSATTGRAPAAAKSKASRSTAHAHTQAQTQAQAQPAVQAQVKARPQGRPLPAPAPHPPAAGVEAVLHEQIRYLRDQLERREAALRTKDAVITELMQQLAKFAKRALPTAPAEPEGLRVDFDRYRASQREALSRHEQAIASISETLSLVRDHLILLRPDADPAGED